MSLNGQGFLVIINNEIMKDLLNLGKALDKKEQQKINGGASGCLPGIYDVCTAEEEALAAAGDPFYMCKCGEPLGWDPQWPF
jgi:hypothetical protein